MSIQPTARLGQFIARCSLSSMPADALEKAAMCLLDGVGLAFLAQSEPTSVAVRDLAAVSNDCSLAASLWIDGKKVPITDAVLANAVAVHAQFHDDSDNASWSHPGSFVLPVALALGETLDLPLVRVLRAVVVGYSTASWLGANERVARALIERGVRTSPALGTVASAAVGALLLNLDGERARSAIGIACSITGGVLEPVGTGSDEWRIQVGHAARGGLLAAQLAARDVHGAPTGLEGKKGLMRALAGLDSIPPEWDEDPRPEDILNICAKPWSTLGDNMSVVIAAKLLFDAGIDHHRITRIKVKVWRHYAEYPGTSYRGPFDRVAQAIASMTFSTAAMLVYGELEFDKPHDHRQDPEILRLVPLIEIEPDDDGGPYDADVEIELSDGSRLSKSAHQAPKTQLFHDRPTASALLESRLTRTGKAAGTGSRIADALFDVLDGGSIISTRDFLAAFHQQP
jgi:2-methylcitrate dehydratase PrpD